jgi:pimeloyl-ACP methyl ester carboxylesterase
MTTMQRTLTGVRRRMWRLIILMALAVVTSFIAWLVARPSMIPVGHGRIEALVRGSGEPAVILEAGLEGGLGSFAELQGRLARSTRTLAYDRAGIGRSSPGTEPRTAEQIARELRVLIASAGIRPPVILACYATGCLYTLVFAHDFPHETAGIVLIDPMTGRFEQRMSSAAAAQGGGAAEIRRSMGARRELAALPTTLAQAEKAWPLPAVPCIVVTALKPTGKWPFKTEADMNAWLADNDALVGRLPDATHIVLPRATHATVLADKSIVRPIVELIDALKPGGG